MRLRAQRCWAGRVSGLLLVLTLVIPALGCHDRRHAASIVQEQPQLVLTTRELLSPSSLPVPLKGGLDTSGEGPMRPRVALVLGSGGTRGIAHIGVLGVLRKEGIPIDLVVGCSAGAVVGALFCSGIGQEELERIAQTSKRRQLFDYVISKNGLIDGGRFEEFVGEHIGRRRFSQLNTPLAVICTDVESAEEIVVTRGDVARAVRASCTLPGLMVPIRVNGRLLVDGGVIDKLPVSVAKELGADIIIAVDVARDTQGVEVTNLVDVLVQSITIMGKRMTEAEARLADVLIRPEVGQVSIADFEDARECIDAGIKAATVALPTIRGLLARERGTEQDLAQ